MSHLLLHRKSVHVLEDPQHAEELDRLRIAFQKTMYVDKTTQRTDNYGYSFIAGYHGDTLVVLLASSNYYTNSNIGSFLSSLAPCLLGSFGNIPQ